jgi:hypothetical protein
LPSVFTIEIGGNEAQNLREARELCHEEWLKDDLAEAKSDGAPFIEQHQPSRCETQWNLWLCLSLKSHSPNQMKQAAIANSGKLINLRAISLFNPIRSSPACRSNAPPHAIIVSTMLKITAAFPLRSL